MNLPNMLTITATVEHLAKANEAADHHLWRSCSCVVVQAVRALYPNEDISCGSDRLHISGEGYVLDDVAQQLISDYDAGSLDPTSLPITFGAYQYQNRME